MLDGMAEVVGKWGVGLPSWLFLLSWEATAPPTDKLTFKLSSSIKVRPGIGLAVTRRQGGKMWQATSLRT